MVWWFTHLGLLQLLILASSASGIPLNAKISTLIHVRTVRYRVRLHSPMVHWHTIIRHPHCILGLALSFGSRLELDWPLLIVFSRLCSRLARLHSVMLGFSAFNNNSFLPLGWGNLRLINSCVNGCSLLANRKEIAEFQKRGKALLWLHSPSLLCSP